MNRNLGAPALVACVLMACGQLLFTPCQAAKPKPHTTPSAHPSKPGDAPSTRIVDAKTGFTYAVEPAPAWIVPAPETPNLPVAGAAMHYRVIDEQVRVDEQSIAEYSHVVRVVDEPAGLQAASQIELDFDPSYQTMTLHHLDVVRDGQHLDRLDRNRIHLLQRETQLERRMYDGRVTLSIVVDDVRSGDQIDFAYTVGGANPVFGGKFVHTTLLSSFRGPVATYQVRLLAPAGRRIQVRQGPVDATVESKVDGAWRETVFRRESVPQTGIEPGAPYTALFAQQLQFSEFADWAEVADWGRTLFTAHASNARVQHKAAEIKANTPDRKGQVLQALDFVQKDIHYFGTEAGVGSHRPAPPDQVIEQRFGDCKDKVALLTALLKELGVTATPTLVSTQYRRRIDPAAPTPEVFNHVIARVELDDKTFWLDATRSHQTGPLDSRQATGFGSGLPLVAGTTALAALPTAFDTLQASISDHITIDKFTANPKLVSRITYRGDLAEFLREALSTRGLQELAPELAAPYLKIYPSISSTSPLRVEPAADDDAITFVQEFEVPEFWRFPQERALVAGFLHWGALQALSVPKMQTRKDDLAFAIPGIYRHDIRIDFPEDVYRDGASRHFDDGLDQVSVQVKLDGGKRSIKSESQVRFGTDQIDAANWPAYVEKMNKIVQRLAGTVGISAVPLDRLPELNAALKDKDQDLQAHKTKAVTEVQKTAWLKSIVLSAQLDGGRLPPPLQAQALNARGIQYDNLGQPEKARADFVRALSLAPDSTEIENAAAMNAIQTRDLARAIELTTRVLKTSPGDSDALNARALAHYFNAELGAAEADFTELLKSSGVVRRGYPIIWLCLTMRQGGHDASTLATAYPKEQLPTDWPRPVVDLMLGQSTVEAVVKAARGQKNPRESLSEAYFYVGEKYRAEGDLARATDYWQKSLDQGVVEFIENAGSRLRLAASTKN